MAFDWGIIDEDKEFQLIMLEIKSWLEKQMVAEQFWIIDEAGVVYLGGLILRMADVYRNLGE